MACSRQISYSTRKAAGLAKTFATLIRANDDFDVHHRTSNPYLRNSFVFGFPLIGSCQNGTHPMRQSENINTATSSK